MDNVHNVTENILQIVKGSICNFQKILVSNESSGHLVNCI